MKNIRDLNHFVKRLKYAKGLQLIAVLLTSLFASSSAFAVICKNANNTTTQIDNISSRISVPKILPQGTVVWRSENRTMTIQCWKESYNASPAEAIYAYMNPQNATIDDGVTIGVMFNGQDLNTGTTRYKVSNAEVPYCYDNETRCKANHSVTLTVNYYVYIAVGLKKSPSSSTAYSGAYNLSVFQLDGVGGLNNIPGSNFNYTLNNLYAVTFIPCAANVGVYPNNIDFGNVRVPTASTDLGSTVKSKDFKVTVEKTCATPVKLTAVYSSPASKINESTLDLNNGLGLKVKDLNTSNYVKFGDINPLADMTSSLSLEIPFSGELSWVNQNYAVGEFNTSITIDVYYN